MVNGCNVIHTTTRYVLITVHKLDEDLSLLYSQSHLLLTPDEKQNTNIAMNMQDIVRRCLINCRIFLRY